MRFFAIFVVDAFGRVYFRQHRLSYDQLADWILAGTAVARFIMATISDEIVILAVFTVFGDSAEIWEAGGAGVGGGTTPNLRINSLIPRIFLVTLPKLNYRMFLFLMQNGRLVLK